MTTKEIVDGLKFTVEMFLFDPNTGETYTEPRNDMDKTTIDACKGAIELLEQEPCEDAVSREDALTALTGDITGYTIEDYIARTRVRLQNLPPVTPKQRLCKDCKWWKDSDGIYRRGIEAESRCPINCKEVFEGNGYCYMFEPKMEGESE